MADLSKIKLNGTVYNLKDAEARENIASINLNDYLKKTSEDGSVIREYRSNTEYGMEASDDEGYMDFSINPSYFGLYSERYAQDHPELNGTSQMSLSPSHIEMRANEISINGIITPTNNTDVVNKKYVDDAISNIKIPTTISSFTNDSGYQNSTQVQTAINTAIGDINSFEVAVVSSLPASDINDHTIYFVPQAVNSSVHDEYMYINNNWELIGTTAVDLSGYLQTSDIADWAKASTKPSYTASEVGAMSTSHAANAITTQDISNWNAKPSSDTNTTYSLSISGNRITLTPSSGTATYVDLPVYDGGVE